jgi:hypothetical protein
LQQVAINKEHLLGQGRTIEKKKGNNRDEEKGEN